MPASITPRAVKTVGLLILLAGLFVAAAAYYNMTSTSTLVGAATQRQEMFATPTPGSGASGQAAETSFLDGPAFNWTLAALAIVVGGAFYVVGRRMDDIDEPEPRQY